MSRVEGLKELSEKLVKLGELGGKTLRNATVSATNPVFKEIKAAAPVGSVAHRTYKGRLVAPGFLKRSIKRRSSYKNGKATVIIGVAAEAFYGVQFVDRGTRKMPAKKWFKFTFIKNQSSMENGLATELRKRIDKIAK